MLHSVAQSVGIRNRRKLLPNDPLLLGEPEIEEVNDEEGE